MKQQEYFKDILKSASCRKAKRIIGPSPMIFAVKQFCGALAKKEVTLLRDLNDEEILSQWRKFTESKIKEDAQEEVKNLLQLLLAKISG